jgi:hypothetical protein
MADQLADLAVEGSEATKKKNSFRFRGNRKKLLLACNYREVLEQLKSNCC